MNSFSTNHDSISYKSQIQSKKKYKIILLGDSGVGKTSIINRFINGKFQPNQNPTIGIDFLVKNMNYQGNTIRVQLWDTAGQQKFKSLIPNYLKDATAAIFVFDFQRPQTLKNLQDWISMFRNNNLHPSGPKNMIGMICGNKSEIQSQIQENQIKRNYMNQWININFLIKMSQQKQEITLNNYFTQYFKLSFLSKINKKQKEKKCCKKDRQPINKFKRKNVMKEQQLKEGLKPKLDQKTINLKKLMKMKNNKKIKIFNSKNSQNQKIIKINVNVEQNKVNYLNKSFSVSFSYLQFFILQFFQLISDQKQGFNVLISNKFFQFSLFLLIRNCLLNVFHQCFLRFNIIFSIHTYSLNKSTFHQTVQLISYFFNLSFWKIFCLSQCIYFLNFKIVQTFQTIYLFQENLNLYILITGEHLFNVFNNFLRAFSKFQQKSLNQRHTKFVLWQH